MNNPAAENESIDGIRKHAVPLIVFTVALALAIAVNAGASYLPYWTMEGALVWAAIAYLLSSFVVWFVPGRYLLAAYVLTLGAWAIMFRFTGDMGANDHFTGAALFFSLLVFTPCLALKSYFCMRKAQRATRVHSECAEQIVEVRAD